MSAETVRDAGTLPQLLHRVQHAATRRVETALAGEATIDQWRVLDLLADGHGHPMSEIAAHVLVPAPTLTKIVDRLVDNALVHRRVDERDRRRVLVLLADRGRALHSGLAPAVAEAERGLTGVLDAADAGRLRDLLARLASD